MPEAHVVTTSLQDPNDYILCDPCYEALPPKLKLQERMVDVGNAPCDGCGKVIENAPA